MILLTGGVQSDQARRNRKSGGCQGLGAGMNKELLSGYGVLIQQDGKVLEIRSVTRCVAYG